MRAGMNSTQTTNGPIRVRQGMVSDVITSLHGSYAQRRGFAAVMAWSSVASTELAN